MANQEILDMVFPVPEPEKKICKYCHKGKPILHEDLADGGYFHKDCLKKNIEKECLINKKKIEKEIRDALREATIPYINLKKESEN